MRARKRLFAERGGGPNREENMPNTPKRAKTELNLLDDIRWEHGGVHTPRLHTHKKRQTMWGVCGICLRQIRMGVLCQSHWFNHGLEITQGY